jgi:hypothetical protein
MSFFPFFKKLIGCKEKITIFYSTMDIGNTHFTTKKQLEQYIQHIISTIGICSSLLYNEHYPFFIDLFQRHPRYPEKCKNMIDISIQPNIITPQYLELRLINSDGTTDAISWKQCVSGKARNPFHCALRVAVDDQILSFRQSHPMICALCNKIDADEYHVDHVMHFEQIVHDFLQMNQSNPPTVFQNTPDNRKTFTEDDHQYEHQWKLYHNTHAILRILCRSCNLTRPKWKK